MRGATLVGIAPRTRGPVTGSEIAGTELFLSQGSWRLWQIEGEGQVWRSEEDLRRLALEGEMLQLQ